MCDVTVARLSDMETNDQDYITRSHLGNILQAGDNVWGFDVLRGNVNDESDEEDHLAWCCLRCGAN